MAVARFAGAQASLAPRSFFMNQHIAAFVARLAQTPASGPVCNPYALDSGDPGVDRANAIRRQNLRLYLKAMIAVEPWLLLVGEAPGYRGGRLTGVPFTSEAVMLDGSIWPFGARAGYRKTAEQSQVVKEATATILWSALADRRPLPLLWNAFPFHPHRSSDPWSNRRPLRAELEVGALFLTGIIDLFRPTVIAAAGRSAARALELAGHGDYVSLRHPSHGGKAAFAAGLEEIQPPAAGS